MTPEAITLRAKDESLRKISRRCLYLGSVPVLILLILVVALHLFLSAHPASRKAFEPPLLLPILNTVFVFIASGLVCFVAMRSYLFSGAPTLLSLGCGVLTLGLGALLAGWLIGPAGPNANITVFNMSALLSAMFHTAGSIISLRQKPPELKLSVRRRKLATAYVGVFALVGLLALAAAAGLLPRFVQGKDPTMVRQIVLACGLVLFSVSCVFMMSRFVRSQSRFLLWYSLALALLALNVLCFFLAQIPADPIIWAGRIARYMAGVYFVLALVFATRDARSKGIDLDHAIADIFSSSRVYWQDILATVSDAIISYNDKRQILQWNQAAERMFGYSYEEAIGKDVVKILPGIQTVGVNAGHTLNAGVVEIDLKRKNDTLLWCEVSISVRELEPHHKIVTLVIRDVTDRKRTEAALKELNERLEERVAERTAALAASEQRWATTLASIGDAVIATDLSGKITFMNKVAVELTGWTLSEARLKPVAEVFHIINEHTRNRVEDPVAKVLKEGVIAGLANHTVLVGKSGKEVPIDDSGAPIQDQDGKIMGVVLIFRDITERKRSEEELRQRTLELQQLTEKLEERVKERTSDLANLSAQLVSAQENERRRVSYDLHDNVWQTLLAIRFEIGSLFSGQDDWSALRNKSTQVMADVLGAVGKIRSMQGDLWPYVLDDIGLVATIDWFCREFEKDHSGLAIEKVNGIPEAEIPSSAKIVIYRIMQEAMSNVAKHSQASHVTLRLTKRDRRIEFTVEDNGVGFDPEETIAKRAPWGGLGLLSIKARTELSGGLFNLESAKGKGTTVRASWPSIK